MAAPGIGGRAAPRQQDLVERALPRCVQPRIAVIQAGYRNRFGHPAGEVLDRYRERGVMVVASPACGAWQWRADSPADASCEHEVAHRYWHHRLEPSPP